jgi:hypothetical protein
MISCSNSEVKKMPEVSSGKLIRLEHFESKYVNPRNIDIYLPANYEAGKKYAVIYMHDGQMLFDSTTTWNKQEWHVDEVLTKLISEKKIKDCIVVAIFNNDENRNAEYFPAVALDRLLEPARGSLVKTLLKDKPLSDNYLKFIVEELKPHIDNTFPTYSDPANTVIMGSGMGGLISLYAFCKYPMVFGSVGCLSTQWPIIGSGVLYNKTISDNTALAFREYVFSHLPRPPSGKIYFDYGTETIDSIYKPYQQLVDTMMKKAGYTSENWLTKEFVNEGHSERSLSRRLSVPLVYFLEK